jgi:hypothetical protein
LVLAYFRIFEKVIWKMRRFKRLNVISRKKSHPDLQKTTKVCCGTKEGSVCLTSRS